MAIFFGGSFPSARQSVRTTQQVPKEPEKTTQHLPNKTTSTPPIKTIKTTSTPTTETSKSPSTPTTETSKTTSTPTTETSKTTSTPTTETCKTTSTPTTETSETTSTPTTETSKTTSTPTTETSKTTSTPTTETSKTTSIPTTETSKTTSTPTTETSKSRSTPTTETSKSRSTPTTETSKTTSTPTTETSKTTSTPTTETSKTTSTPTTETSKTTSTPTTDSTKTTPSIITTETITPTPTTQITTHIPKSTPTTILTTETIQPTRTSTTTHTIRPVSTSTSASPTTIPTTTTTKQIKTTAATTRPTTVAPTTRISTTTDDHDHRCKNGGTWDEDDEECDCPDDYYGDHCEYVHENVEIETVEATVNAAVRIKNQNFSDNLNDNTTEEFKKFSRDFKQQMNIIYNGIKGYKCVRIINIRNGSIIVDHDVVIKITNSAELSPGYLNETAKKIENKLKNTTCDNSIGGSCTGFQFDSSYVKVQESGIPDPCGSRVPENLKQYYQLIFIKNKAICASICHEARNDSVKCENGKCGMENDGPRCYCDVSDDYWYYGDLCDIAFHKNGLIAGLSVTLTLLLLGLLTLIVYIVWFRKATKEDLRKREDEKNKIISEKWKDGDFEWDNPEAIIVANTETTDFKCNADMYNTVHHVVKAAKHAFEDSDLISPTENSCPLLPHLVWEYELASDRVPACQSSKYNETRGIQKHNLITLDVQLMKRIRPIDLTIAKIELGITLQAELDCWIYIIGIWVHPFGMENPHYKLQMFKTLKTTSTPTTEASKATSTPTIGTIETTSTPTTETSKTTSTPTTETSETISTPTTKISETSTSTTETSETTSAPHTETTETISTTTIDTSKTTFTPTTATNETTSRPTTETNETTSTPITEPRETTSTHTRETSKTTSTPTTQTSKTTSTPTTETSKTTSTPTTETSKTTSTPTTETSKTTSTPTTETSKTNSTPTTQTSKTTSTPTTNTSKTTSTPTTETSKTTSTPTTDSTKTTPSVITTETITPTPTTQITTHIPKSTPTTTTETIQPTGTSTTPTSTGVTETSGPTTRGATETSETSRTSTTDTSGPTTRGATETIQPTRTSTATHTIRPASTSTSSSPTTISTTTTTKQIKTTAATTRPTTVAPTTRISTTTDDHDHHCKNGGTWDEADEECDCLDDYHGDHCEYVIDHHCKNGGTWDEDDEECDCPDDYYGDHCEYVHENIEIETVEATVNAAVRIKNQNFSDNLNDNTTEEFKNFSRDFKQQMNIIYNGIKGYKCVRIINIRNGSIIVDHDVVINITNSAELSPGYLNETAKKIENKLKNTTCDNSTGGSCTGFQFDSSYVKVQESGIPDPCGSRVPENLKQYYQLIFIKNKAICASICHEARNDSVKCENGKCGMENDGPRCYCDVSDDYWYYGDLCDIAFHKNGLIAGLSVTLTLLLLGLLTLIVYMVWFRKATKEDLRKRVDVSSCQPSLIGQGTQKPVANAMAQGNSLAKVHQLAKQVPDLKLCHRYGGD
ncbi:uncharacterized protein LOC121272217 [Carcharodon carcharias]|uniref:uncharacterized protein LOC121272217 n=1 Tax=Carcharodon carcharias TaxID=13397 RepID=UPI001B7DFB47|nr:uncharacterized protein LOC121272217 [Carcharodon carcharias]